MEKNLKTQTNLVRRKPSGVYYFRARVPAQLVPLLRKKVIFDSLKTKDKAIAVAAASRRRNELQQELRRVQSIVPDRLTVQERLFLSNEEINAICERYLAHTLERDDSYRFEGMSEASSELHQDILESWSGIISSAVARGDTSVVTTELESYLNAHVGIQLDQNTPSYKKLAFEFLKTEAAATRDRLARQRGEHVKTPSISVGRSTFDVLIAKWATLRAAKPVTRKAFQATFDELASIHPGLYVETTTKAHLLVWRDRLIDAKQAPGTIDKKLSYLRAAFSVAVDEDWVTTNPARGVQAPAGPDKKARVPFSVDDLKNLFNSKVFAMGARPKGGGGEAAYWLPLLALYTGARLEELAQLRVGDVVHSKPLGWYLDISDTGEDASVKTDSSRRRVPLHGELKRFGFLEYLEQFKETPAVFLFPGLVPDTKGNRSGNYSKWFGRYRKQVGIRDKRKVFHSFRHGFIDACRDCSVSSEIRDVLVGHANQAVSAEYGSDKYPLKPLFAAIEQVQFAGLTLTHLYRDKAA